MSSKTERGRDSCAVRSGKEGLTWDEYVLVLFVVGVVVVVLSLLVVVMVVVVVVAEVVVAAVAATALCGDRV